MRDSAHSEAHTHDIGQKAKQFGLAAQIADLNRVVPQHIEGLQQLQIAILRLAALAQRLAQRNESLSALLRVRFLSINRHFLESNLIQKHDVAQDLVEAS